MFNPIKPTEFYWAHLAQPCFRDLYKIKIILFKSFIDMQLF